MPRARPRIGHVRVPGAAAQVTISTPSGGSTSGGVISARWRTTTELAPFLGEPTPLREGEALGVVVEHRDLELAQAALGRPRRDRLVQRGPTPRRRCSGEHGDDREDAIDALRKDGADRGADRGAVNARHVVDVIANARLERAHVVHRERIVRPDGVVDIQRELLVRFAAARGDLEHGRNNRFSAT